MWLMGVVSRRWVWLVGGIYGYGYNVLVWLVGVVVRRYIDILTILIKFPYSTCISSFFGSSIPTSLFILKMFFRSLTLKSHPRNAHASMLLPIVLEMNETKFIHVIKCFNRVIT